MDDLTLRYYDAEMRYLLEAGEEFARAHPEQAAMLNLDKAGARDPYLLIWRDAEPILCAIH